MALFGMKALGPRKTKLNTRKHMVKKRLYSAKRAHKRFMKLTTPIA